MSALPTRADLAGTPTRAELQAILLATYDMLAQRLAAGTTGAGAASAAELLLARNSLGLGAGADIASAATLDLSAATGKHVRITGTVATTGVTISNGDEKWCYPTAAWPLTYNATTMPLPGAVSYTCQAGDLVIFSKNGSGTLSVEVLKADGTPLILVNSSTANAARASLLQLPPVRQTVISGPVDTNGLPSFGGSTGTSTVTASGTLVATTANGVSGDRIGSIVNPSWTGLSAISTTYYAYLDIAADGTCTTGSTTLQPTYRWGGADVTTNGQATFNIQEMQMKVGNGAAAVQSYRVFVGEFATGGGGTVTTITWYALMGRYDSGFTNTLPAVATSVSRNHNIGTFPSDVRLIIKNLTTEGGYTVGDEVDCYMTYTGGGGYSNPPPRVRTRLACGFSNENTGLLLTPKAGGSAITVTLANWAYKLVANRGW